MHSLLLTALFFPVLINPQIKNRAEPTIDAHPASYSFGIEMIFTASVHSSEAILKAQLIVQEGFSRPSSSPAEVSGSEDFSLSIRRNLETEPLFPFSSMGYWWEVELSSGRKLISGMQTVQYSDDRFSWRRYEKGRAAVEWVEGDSSAAENAAELMLLALGTISADLEAPIPDRAVLYIYPRLAEFRSALGNRIRGWEGAMSDPASGIILLAAASGAEGRRPLAVLLPHEIVHILLGAKWKSACTLLPLWLVEGMAAGYEMEPRPEADQALRQAARAGGLIPLQTLCTVFPAEESSAMLAYAESKSFVAFLKETYGLAAVRQAMAAYADGAECGHGLETSTGRTLSELELVWSDRLGSGDPWLSSSWEMVLAGVALLAGVLAVRWMIQHPHINLPWKKGKAE